MERPAGEEVLWCALGALSHCGSTEVQGELAAPLAILLTESRQDGNVRRRVACSAACLCSNPLPATNGNYRGTRCEGAAELFVNGAHDLFFRAGESPPIKPKKRKSSDPPGAPEQFVSSTHGYWMSSCHLLSALLRARDDHAEFVLEDDMFEPSRLYTCISAICARVLDTTQAKDQNQGDSDKKAIIDSNEFTVNGFKECDVFLVCTLMDLLSTMTGRFPDKRFFPAPDDNSPFAVINGFFTSKMQNDNFPDDGTLGKKQSIHSNAWNALRLQWLQLLSTMLISREEDGEGLALRSQYAADIIASNVVEMLQSGDHDTR